MILQCVCVKMAVTIIMISLSGVHGYYRLGQCPEFENCVKMAVINERSKTTLFNTIVQNYMSGDYLGSLDAAMELLCSNTPAVLQCVEDVTYEDCFQIKRMLYGYDSTNMQPMFDSLCLYTNEISGIFRCVSTIENLEWFFGCIDNMFMGITQTKTGQTYIDMEEYKCSKDGTKPAVNDLVVCLTEHMEGRCDKDIITFIREKNVYAQQYACSRGEEISKQNIMEVFEQFRIVKQNYAKLKLQYNL